MQEVIGSTPIFSTKATTIRWSLFLYIYEPMTSEALLFKGGFGRIVYIDKMRLRIGSTPIFSTKAVAYSDRLFFVHINLSL